MKYVLPQTALKLRAIGFPQGKTPYLWHKGKGAKVSFKKYGIVAGEEHWHIYKRNKHDISAFGDSHGYNRWVSAPTVEQVMRWKCVTEAEQELDKMGIQINKVMLVSIINDIAEALDIKLLNDEFGERS